MGSVRINIKDIMEVFKLYEVYLSRIFSRKRDIVMMVIRLFQNIY